MLEDWPPMERVRRFFARMFGPRDRPRYDGGSTHSDKHGVREPNKPRPPRRTSAVALKEPDE
jgi:hypothetical protein